MPSVEELLPVAEVDANTRSAMDSRIEIDADTRIIQMMPQDELFGVESDEKSERKYFKVPKIVGNGVDLSKLQLRINYQNASKIPSGKDMYIVTDATVYNDEWVYFSWELSRKVTQYKGNIYFIVCAVKADSNGNITNEWNTTLAEGKVLEGLEVETSQEQQYQASDYLEQLKQQLLDYSKEIKDTFPSDYTQIQDDIGSLKEDLSQLSEEIEEIGAYRVNEFNKDDITIGKYPNSSIGQSINAFVEKENSFVCNQRWRIKKGDVLRWTWSYASFYIYDENGYLIEKLGSDGLKEGTIQSDNAHTLVYLGTNSHSENYVDNFMFTINRELPTEYVEYGVIGIDTYNDKKTNERIDEIVNTDHIPYVVLDFDNQIASLDDNVVTLLEKYGFKGSFVGWKNPTVFMELLNRGWDIGTYDNSPDILPPSTTIDSTDETDISQYDNYVYQAQKKQSDIGIFNPTVWCCIQNKWGSALAKGVKKYGYKMARAYQTGDVYNLNYDKDFPILDSQRFYTGDLSTVNGVIDNVANKPNSIVVILAHMLVDTTEEDRGFDCLASEYESMLIHLKEKADSGLIKVITFRELYRELYPNNGYENDYNRLLKMSQFDYSV